MIWLASVNPRRKRNRQHKQHKIFTSCVFYVRMFVESEVIPYMAKNEFRIVITLKEKENKIAVDVLPKPSAKRPFPLNKAVNTFVGGLEIAFDNWFKTLAVLRPATPEERAENVYIFADQEKDNALYKLRVQVYNSLSVAFTGILEKAFPDVMYIAGAIQQNQEIVDGGDEKAIKEREKVISNIALKIKHTGGDRDGDSH